MYLLENVVQPYSWGSTDAIPDLLGRPDTGEPQAELWIGAHPLAPSRVDGVGLDAFLAAHPEAADGKGLPLLLKVLSAAAPLSLQVHPTLEQAQAGFAAENAAGIPLDDPARSYKDANHKPELIVALTPFSALAGFRELDESAAEIAALAGQPLPADDVKAAVLWLLTEPAAREFAAAVVAGAAAHPELPGADTVNYIAGFYPDDPGVVVALLLNRVDMPPGGAIFLDAGTVHAYLQGTGIEVMATSDNVLRAGLTGKHIDVAELARIANFEPDWPQVVDALATTPMFSHSERRDYNVESAGIELVDTRLNGQEKPLHLAKGPALLLALEGEIALTADAGELPGSQATLTLAKGQSAFVPHGEYALASGTGRVFALHESVLS
ncbi:MAG: mannose-6-phosphate isomerase, class I [Propionibacteriaceae bacterium]|nr:mannose-6-phosphate isomerase, class I [Propionibacteriaceae bacterium]